MNHLTSNDHKDTIDDAKTKAKNCFDSGVYLDNSPYRNTPMNSHNASLAEAFDLEIEKLRKAN